MANRWFRLAQRPTRRLAAVVVAVAVAFGGGVGGTPTSAADVAPSAPTNVRWAVVRSPQLELWWTVPNQGFTTPLAGLASRGFLAVAFFADFSRIMAGIVRTQNRRRNR